MGFGIGDIASGIKNAVKSAGEAVGHVAEAVGGGVKEAEKKVADVVKSAVESIAGRSGFDNDNPGHGPVADSKPKGSGGSSYA